MGRYFCSLAAATTFSLAALCFTGTSSAGGLDLGGIVGGTLGGSSGSYGGTSGGISANAGATIGHSGADAKAKASIGHTINAKAKVVLYKKKLYAGAKLLVGKHHPGYGKNGKIAKVTAVIGTKPLNAKAKVLLGNSAKAKVYASLGGKTKVTGKVAVAGIAANVRVGLNLGGFGNNPGGNNGTPPGAGESTPVAMAGTFRDLSTHDQMILTRRCSAVLAAPSRYDSDMVALCRIIATL